MFPRYYIHSDKFCMSKFSTNISPIEFALEWVKNFEENISQYYMDSGFKSSITYWWVVRREYHTTMWIHILVWWRQHFVCSSTGVFVSRYKTGYVTPDPIALPDIILQSASCDCSYSCCEWSRMTDTREWHKLERKWTFKGVFGHCRYSHPPSEVQRVRCYAL